MIYSVCKCYMRPSVRYLTREEKERFAKDFWNLKATPLPPKQSVKFKCQIWSEITNKFSKKCLDASSLWLSRRISA